MTWITGISLLALAMLASHRYTQTKNTRALLVQLAALALCSAFLYALFDFPFSAEPASRGGESNDIYFVIVLYACMLLGMLAQYGHTRFSQPQRTRKKFDLGLFFAPVFASPIIFIPLFAALQNSVSDLNTRVMTFLVAFENGFFWKEYFDHRRAEKGEA
jgi:hypothetical protein